jgi:DNA-nicking Smr family endonuclease
MRKVRGKARKLALLDAASQPAAPRRRRGQLSEADKAAWQAYAATVLPLAGRPPMPPPPPATAPTPPPVAAPTEAAARGPAAAPKPLRLPEIQVGQAPGGLDAKRWTALRRGRTGPERTLDLHGRRAQEAHAAVRAFLADCVAEGLRCVAVVTGKGSSGESGVLRREFPHWLNAPDLRPLVLGAAHPHAANPGAVHLLLRRRR